MWQGHVCCVGEAVDVRTDLIDGQLVAGGAATRAPRRRPLGRSGARVALELDQMEVAPSIDLGKSRGATSWPTDLVREVSAARPHTFNSAKEGGDVHQGTRARTFQPSTPPWCQQRMRVGWPFGGAFVLSRHPNRPSREGVEMT
jgi:hypothetical protein